MHSFVFAAALALVGCLLDSVPVRAADDDHNENRKVTLIHIGDIHGHLVPQPNLRSDGTGRLEGGLARLYTKIKEVRRRSTNTLLINTGDTIQGSAEALYTRGQAVVDVLNLFGIDAFAPGNWDFVYGTDRFRELFAGPAARAPWTAVAANAYAVSGPSCGTGPRILPPYVVKHVGGLRIGILGFTTDRGPQVVGTDVTRGLCFTKGDAEVATFVPILRNDEHVDLLVMVSELGLANNIRLAEAHPGIDVILSSDMHERTRKPVVTSTGTIIVEEGDGGTVLGELTIKVRKGFVKDFKWKAHTIDTRLEEDPTIAAAVAVVRKTFVTGADFVVQHVNPFNGTLLQRPIDTVVGYTTIPLHRANFSDEEMPAVIEGSSHDFLTDAFRAMGMADIGAIRGFRYGTHVAPGPITLADLYHFIPIGPLIARGTITGLSLKNQIESAADGSLNPDVSKWTGGWLFNFGGVTMDIDPYQPAGSRASNIMVLDRETNTWGPLDVLRDYTYASYFYAADPALINRVPATNITVVKDEKGNDLDGTEVIVRYLRSLQDRTVAPALNRIRLLQPLPAPVFKNPELQPLRGATP